MSCNAGTTAAGEPTLVITSSTLWRTRHCQVVGHARRDRMIRLGQHGAASSGAANSRAWMSVSHWSSSSVLRALAVGKAPITPLRQAATTRSTPDTLSIGAAISGRRSRRVMWSGRLMRHGGLQLTLRVLPAQKGARRSTFSTLPAADSGNASRNSTLRGHL
jgi:hypothetical protein